MVKELSDGVTELKYCKNFERNSHWRKLSMIMVWERDCNASPKPEFFLFSLFNISQLIWVCLGLKFSQMILHTETSNRCTIEPFSLKLCTSQHSYPVPLNKTMIMFAQLLCSYFCIISSYFFLCLSLLQQRDPSRKPEGGEKSKEVILID